MDHLGVASETIDITPPGARDLPGARPRAVRHRLPRARRRGLPGRAGAACPRERRHDLIFENVQARLRTFLLMSRGFVVGTGDLSELALGWCTYNGDHMSMYNPNCSIPKTLVQVPGRVRGAERVRRRAGARHPALDRRDDDLARAAAGRRERRDRAVDRGDARPVRAPRLHPLQRGPVRLLAREDPLPEPSTPTSPSPIGRELIERTLRTFYRRFFSQQFKRSCVPDGPKVGTVSLSPRGDWRMPSDADPAAWLRW